MTEKEKQSMKNEALHRKQFTFYDSYLNAVLTLPKCRRFEVLLGIVGYGLQGREPDLTGPSRSVFEAVRPSLDAVRRKAAARLAQNAAEAPDRPAVLPTVRI